MTLAAERGGYALIGEFDLYRTRHSANTWTHLKPGGQIALKLYDEVTLTRAVSTALSALRRRGLDDQRALRHLMAFIDNKSSPSAPLLLIGETDYSEDDSLVLGAIARDVGFTPLLLPQVFVQPPLDAVATGAKSYDDIVANSAADISPATDERPYFFQFEKRIPSSLVPLVLLAAVIAVATLLVIVHRLRFGFGAAQKGYPLLFAMLGFGFIALEIYAIQQTRLFLGHPTIAVTLVLVTFLVGGGLGSGLSQRLSNDLIERLPQLMTAAVVILSIVWSGIWPALNSAFVANGLAVRGAIAALSLLPLALCMGVPFPQALKIIARDGEGHVALAWSINGLMTVVGTVAAVVLSITVGFSAVLWLGAAGYVLATVVLAIVQRGNGI